MRAATVQLRDVLKRSFDYVYVVDVFSNGVRVLKDLPVTNVQLDDDSTSLVQGTGSFTVAYQGDFAESIAPQNIGDLLSPFGNEVIVYVVVNAGPGFTERITMGHYLISETPNIVTQIALFGGGVISRGDLVDVSLKDPMSGIQRDRFDVPGAPPDLSSVWKEFQRLADLPVTRTVADAAISASVAYQEDKLQAVYDLATVLDATACMTPDGTVSMRPNVWPAPVDVLQNGDKGTLVNIGRGMQNELVYNKIVVRQSGANGSEVLASAEISDGPLRTRNADGSRSPYRTVPYFYSSQFITNTAQAQAYAITQLPRVSALRSVKVVLTETFNPLRELGDPLTVNRYAGTVLANTFLGRVTHISRTNGPTQQTTVAVGQ